MARAPNDTADSRSPSSALRRVLAVKRGAGGGASQKERRGNNNKLGNKRLVRPATPTPCEENRSGTSRPGKAQEESDGSDSGSDSGQDETATTHVYFRIGETVHTDSSRPPTQKRTQKQAQPDGQVAQQVFTRLNDALLSFIRCTKQRARKTAVVSKRQLEDTHAKIRWVDQMMAALHAEREGLTRCAVAAERTYDRAVQAESLLSRILATREAAGWHLPMELLLPEVHGATAAEHAMRCLDVGPPFDQLGQRETQIDAYMQSLKAREAEATEMFSAMEVQEQQLNQNQSTLVAALEERLREEEKLDREKAERAKELQLMGQQKLRTDRDEQALQRWNERLQRRREAVQMQQTKIRKDMEALRREEMDRECALPEHSLAHFCAEEIGRDDEETDNETDDDDEESLIRCGVHDAFTAGNNSSGGIAPAESDDDSDLIEPPIEKMRGGADDNTHEANENQDGGRHLVHRPTPPRRRPVLNKGNNSSNESSAEAQQQTTMARSLLSFQNL